MSQTIIRQFLENRVKAWADPAGIDMQAENVGYLPVDDRIYVRCTLLPGRTASQDVQGKHRAYVGVFQIDVRAPVGAGAGAAQTIAEQLVELFPNTDRLSDGTVTVLIASPTSIGPASEDGIRYQVPVTVQYRADVVVA